MKKTELTPWGAGSVFFMPLTPLLGYIRIQI